MPYRPIRMIIKNQKVISCTPDTTVSEAARLMEQKNVGALMVVKDHTLIAIFTERDAVFRVLAKGRDAQTTRVTEVSTLTPQTIHPDKPFGHALHMMYEGGFRHVPVVEYSRPVGMVSARDALGPELEDFADELRQREQIEQVLG